jgi:hypothetical protein
MLNPHKKSLEKLANPKVSIYEKRKTFLKQLTYMMLAGWYCLQLLLYQLNNNNTEFVWGGVGGFLLPTHVEVELGCGNILKAPQFYIYPWSSYSEASACWACLRLVPFALSMLKHVS